MSNAKHNRKTQEFFIEQPELHDIARPVLEFLKEQPDDWWIDKHGHAPASKDWKFACCTTKQSIKMTDVSPCTVCYKCGRMKTRGSMLHYLPGTACSMNPQFLCSRYCLSRHVTDIMGKAVASTIDYFTDDELRLPPHHQKLKWMSYAHLVAGQTKAEISLCPIHASIVSQSCLIASTSCLTRARVVSLCVLFLSQSCLSLVLLRLIREVHDMPRREYMECGACGRYAKCKWCQCRNRAYCSGSCKKKRWEEWGSCCSNRQKRTAMMCCMVCMEYAKCRTCLCGADWYCSRDCQKQHWEEHKQYCSVKLVRRAEFAARNCGKDT